MQRSAKFATPPGSIADLMNERTRTHVVTIVPLTLVIYRRARRLRVVGYADNRPAFK